MEFIQRNTTIYHFIEMCSSGLNNEGWLYGKLISYHFVLK